MKFFVAIALIATMASAAVIKPTVVSEQIAQIQEVIAAIQSPSTNPATAAALEAMLADLLGIKPEPVIVGPALIDFPLPDGGAVAAPIVEPSPVVVGELEAGQASPLVQVIVNVNQASASPAPVDSAIVDAPQPIIVVEEAVDPVQVVDQVVDPVIVVDTPAVLEPVQVAVPVIVEPVIVGTPIIPSPAVVLPEELN